MTGTTSGLGRLSHAMSGPRSLQWRLQVWHAIVLVAVLVLFGVYVDHLQWETRLQHTDAELNRTADIISTRLRRLFPQPSTPARGTNFGGTGNFPNGRDLFRPPWDNPSSDRTDIPSPPPLSRLVDEVVRRSPTRDGSFSRDGAPGREGSSFRETRGMMALESLPWRPGSVGLSEEFLNSNESNSPLYFVIWDRDGRVLEKSAHAPDVPFPGIRVPLGGFPVRQVSTRGQWREVTYVRWFDINILVGRTMLSDIAAHRRDGLILIGVGTAVLLVGLAGGWWFTSRAIQPIREMSRTAAEISAANLDRRISVSETDTELGQLANVLNSTFDRLQSAFHRQTQFTADASHELRTPVSVILAQIQTALHRPRSAEDYVAALGSCRRAAQRMKRLIEDLLTLARLDAVPDALPHEPVALDEIARETTLLLEPLAAEKEISLHLHASPCRVLGAPDQLGQLVMNVLSNALRYNRREGQVWINVSKDEAHAVLQIRDTGEGIPPESMSKLFDRFYRVDNVRSRQDGGSGLGLSICKAIVDAHHGTIAVESQVGQGSTVTIRIPLAEEVAAPHPDSAVHSREIPVREPVAPGVRHV